MAQPEPVILSKSAINFIYILIYVLAVLVQTAHAEIKPGFEVKPNSNQALAFGTGLQSGVLGVQYLRWLDDPKVIVNVAIGLEGISPGVRIPLVNVNALDLCLDFSTFFSPGILGHLFGSGEGLIFSKDSQLVGSGVSLQYWRKQKSNHWLYLAGGVSAWILLKGHAEGDDDLIIGPEFQVGIVY